MNKLLCFVFLGVIISSCNSRPPLLKSPCVAATEIKDSLAENPCVRRPLTANLLKL